MTEIIGKARLHLWLQLMTPTGRSCGNAKSHQMSVFWWRVSNDFMPCRANLHRRHIEPAGTCMFCGMEDETTFHTLTQFTFAVEFWNKFCTFTGIKLPKLCPRTWARDMMDDSICLEGDRGVIMCDMCSLWRSRNDRQHDKKPIDQGVSMDLALEACSQLWGGK